MTVLPRAASLALVGKRFGRLVVEVVHSGLEVEAGCRCGGRTVTTAFKLRSGGTRSCGCLRTEAMREIGLARRQPPTARFWAMVKKTRGCWLWQGTRVPEGYGKFFAGPRRTDYTRAHRFSWALAKGPIPGGRWVLHRCDNPPCVRPSHLFLGDAVANNRDMVLKGRWRGGAPRGEANASTRLTDRDVCEIRRIYRTGRHLQTEVARRFGISSSYVSRLVRKEKRQEASP